MYIEDVLNRFDGVRETGGGQYSCRCPAHEDKSNSLGIKQGDGDRIMMNCFAGCQTTDVLSAVGLTFKDILPTNDYNEEVKEKAAEVKRRAKAVKAEVKDVIEEVKDVKDAIKGKKRRGRKPKAKK